MVTKMKKEKVISNAEDGLALPIQYSLDNDPNGVAFARILAFARALGVALVPAASSKKPKAARIGRGRPIAAIAASTQKTR